MTPSHQQPRSSAAPTEYTLLGLLRTRVSRGIVLVGAVGMLAACGSNVPSVGEVQTAIVPPTDLPTLDTTPSITLEPTSAATDTTGTPAADTTGTPATGATTTTTTPGTDTTGTPGTPVTDTTGTPATGTPAADTTGTPATGATTTTTTPGTDTTGTPTTDTTGTPTTDTTGTPVSGDAEAVEVSISELMENPDEYLGQQVMVESTVQEVYNPLGVQLNDATTPSPSNTMMLIVVGEERLFSNTTDWLDESVEVMGTLREFNQAEFEREFSWFDADADWVAEVEEGQPVLIADMINPSN